MLLVSREQVYRRKKKTNEKFAFRNKITEVKLRREKILIQTLLNFVVVCFMSKLMLQNKVNRKSEEKQKICL